MNNFWQRIITGTVFIIVIIGSIQFGPISFQVLFLAIALLSLQEFYRIVSKDEIQPNKIIGLIAGSFLYFILTATASGNLDAKWNNLLYSILALVFFAELYRKKKEPFLNIGYTLLGIFYTVLPFALLNKISFHGTDYDPGIILGYFILLWTSDSLAYVFGMLLGKHRLFERISPKKSWEGSIGGLISSLFTAWCLWKFFPQYSLNQWMVISVIIVITGTFGDLTESLLKRSLGIKDSGNILPGHGGLLDRFDGLLLSVPFVWAYLEICN